MIFLKLYLKIKFLGVMHALNNSAFIVFKGEEFALDGKTEQALSNTLRPLGYLTAN